MGPLIAYIITLILLIAAIVAYILLVVRESEPVKGLLVFSPFYLAGPWVYRYIGELYDAYPHWQNFLLVGPMHAMNGWTKFSPWYWGGIVSFWESNDFWGMKLLLIVVFILMGMFYAIIYLAYTALVAVVGTATILLVGILWFFTWIFVVMGGNNVSSAFSKAGLSRAIPPGLA